VPARLVTHSEPGYLRPFVPASLFVGNRRVGADDFDLGDEPPAFTGARSPLKALAQVLHLAFSTLPSSEIALGLSGHTCCLPPIFDDVEHTAAMGETLATVG
jgi:hypothetical protein